MIPSLLALVTVLSLLLYFARCDVARERAAREKLHGVADSAMRGHPLVKWSHPNPLPSSDKWYYRARFAGVEHLFTEEAIRTARHRAESLRSK